MYRTYSIYGVYFDNKYYKQYLMFPYLACILCGIIKFNLFCQTFFVPLSRPDLHCSHIPLYVRTLTKYFGHGMKMMKQVRSAWTPSVNHQTAMQAHLCGSKVKCRQRLASSPSICILHLLQPCCTVTTTQCKFVMNTPISTQSQILYIWLHRLPRIRWIKAIWYLLQVRTLQNK